MFDLAEFYHLKQTPPGIKPAILLSSCKRVNHLTL